MNRGRLDDIFKFIISIVICLIAGFIGSFFTSRSIPVWYAGLNKPSFTPPNQLFAPVWTILYLLMGISAFIIWRKGLHEPQVKAALGIFMVQLVLNVFWSVIFFGFRSPLVAFVEIILLWVTILLTILHFRKVSVTAALLLMPYILWVTFAALLNFSLWRLNV